jgi:hypothetical protein
MCQSEGSRCRATARDRRVPRSQPVSKRPAPQRGGVGHRDRCRTRAVTRAQHRSHRRAPTHGHTRGASFAEGDARSPPAQARERFRAGRSTVPFVRCGFDRWCQPPVRPPRKSRKGGGPIQPFTRGPLRRFTDLGEVLVTMHQTPAILVTIRWTDDRTERERLLPLHA